jgi:hypothetical protein
MLTDAKFVMIVDLDSVSKENLLCEGKMCTGLGLTFYSDAFRHPMHHFTEDDELWCFGNNVLLLDIKETRATVLETETEIVYTWKRQVSFIGIKGKNFCWLRIVKDK